MLVSIDDGVFVATPRLDANIDEDAATSQFAGVAQDQSGSREVVFAHESKERRVLQGQLEAQPA